MNKLLNFVLLLAAVSFPTSTYAGWWDDLFVTPTTSPEKVEQPVEVTTPGLTSDLKSVATGIAKETATQSIVDLVSTSAGVTTDQASGGLGAIFKTAQGTLSKEDFASIAQAVPEMDGLLAAAPTKKIMVV